MVITVLQHSDIGAPGRLGATLRDHGFTLDIRRPDRDGASAVPGDLDNVHGLVILGGPQNVTDISRYGWMQREAELIRAAHAAELPVIGICLGCQLMAHALGGQVAARTRPVIGFHPVSHVSAGQTEPALAGIHWDHQQFFSCGQEVTQLPPGATLLVTSRHTKSVAWKAGLRTYGFMYHFECDQPMLERLVASGEDEMAAAGTTAGEVRAQIDQQYASYARLSSRLCVNLQECCFPMRRRLIA
ncbi:MAG TPA: type 1 glutamine amidotransferase [Phycisphaerales bacterium]|nr:type 1 glutamine amidotransferase [Phycisphaerales bacterium]